MISKAVQTQSNFKQSLPIVAAALGRNCGVTIEIGGSGAFTNGKVISLPFLELETPESERKLLGLLCHECGHVRFSEFNNDEKISAFEHSLDNALEDVRIEMEMDKIYPGAERLLKAAHVSDLESLANKPDWPQTSLIPMFLLCSAERRLLNREWMEPLLKILRDQVISSFGKEVCNKLEGFALRVKDCKSTREVQVLRREILDFLRLKQPQPEGKEDDSGKGEKPSGKNAFKRQRRKSKATPIEELLHSPNGNISNPLALSERFSRITRGNSEPYVKPFPLTDDVCIQGGNPGRGKERLLHAKSDSIALRLALTGLVQSRSATGRWTSNRGRKPCYRQLARLVTGETKVFERTVEKTAPNTAVHILLDASGSMGTNLDLAIRAGLGLVKGLQSIKEVNPALSVFPATSCGMGNFSVVPLIRPGQSLQKIKPEAIGAIHACGCTPLFESLIYAGLMLRRQPCEKRVLIVITDGGVPPDQCAAKVKKLRESGVSVLGIQLGSENFLGDVIPDSVLIENIEDLKAALFGFAKSILL